MDASRRKFIKLATFGTAASVLGGRLWQRDLLAICLPLQDQREAIFKVRISDYPALQSAFGSVRLGINPVAIGDFPDGNVWPILINRDEDGLLHVLDGECRHAGCVVRTYDTFDVGVRCPCHGSLYAIDGRVVRGPATQPLLKYPSQLEGEDTLSIRIPCWGFATQIYVLDVNGTVRVMLDFPTFPNVIYEVRFRQNAQDTWAVVPFTTVPDGVANQMSLSGTGGPAFVYLDRTAASGFWAVSMQLNEV